MHNLKEHFIPWLWSRSVSSACHSNSSHEPQRCRCLTWCLWTLPDKQDVKQQKKKIFSKICARPACKIPNSYWKPWWHGDAVTSALMVTNLQVTFRWRRMCELVVCRRSSVLNIVSQNKIDIQISSPLPLKSISVSFIAKCQENSDAHTHSPSSNPIVFYWVRFTTTRPYRVLNKRLTKSWTWDILCKYQTSLQATWKTHYQIDFHAFDTTFSLLRKDFGRVCEALNSRRGLNEMICVPCPRLLDVPVSGLRKLCRWRPRLVTEDLSFKHARTINRLIWSKKGSKWRFQTWSPGRWSFQELNPLCYMLTGRNR